MTQHIHVLVVDDDAENLSGMCELLGRRRHGPRAPGRRRAARHPAAEGARGVRDRIFRLGQGRGRGARRGRGRVRPQAGPGRAGAAAPNVQPRAAESGAKKRQST